MKAQFLPGRENRREAPGQVEQRKTTGRHRKRKVLLAVLLAAVLMGIYGGSVPDESLKKNAASQVDGEFSRGEVFDVGVRSKVVLIEDDQGQRVALSYLKTPFLERYQNKDMVRGDSGEQLTLQIQVDDGLATMDVRVKFKSLYIDDIQKWNGSYIRTLSILAFMALSVLLSFFYRGRKPGRGNY